MTPDELTLIKIYHIGDGYLPIAYKNFHFSISDLVECLKTCFSGSYFEKLKNAIASKDAKAAFFAADELDNYALLFFLIKFDDSLQDLTKDLAPRHYYKSNKSTAENDGYGPIAWTPNTQALFEKVEAIYIAIEELVKQLGEKTARTNFTELESELEYERKKEQEEFESARRKEQEEFEKSWKQDKTLTKIYYFDGYPAQAYENFRSISNLVQCLKEYFSGSYFQKLKVAIIVKDAKAAFFEAKELDNYAYKIGLFKLDNLLKDLIKDLAPLWPKGNAENDGYGPIAWTPNTQALFEKVEADYIVIEELVKQLMTPTELEYEKSWKQDKTLTKIYEYDGGAWGDACHCHSGSQSGIAEDLKKYFSGSYFEKLKNAIANKDAKAAFFAAKTLDYHVADSLCLGKFNKLLDELEKDLAPLRWKGYAENDGYGPIAWTPNTQALFEKVEADYIVIEELVKQLE